MAPIDALWRFVETATGRNRKHEPAISKSTAALISVLFTALYVLPFYLFRKTRPSPTLNRDAPSVIQARIRAVTVTVTISTLTTLYLLSEKGQLSILTALHYLGFWPISPLAILKPVLLTCLLFLGPLYEDIVLHKSWAPLSTLPTQLLTSLSSSIGYRNYIAGPLTEELLFRSSILPIHLLSPLAESPKQLVFLTPLYFGIAHIHHFYEFRLNHPDTPLLPAVLRTVFQFGFTTVFGWYAAFVYLRTGNLYAVFFIHAFCNYMGLPRTWGKVTIRSQSYNLHRTVRARQVQGERGKEDPVKESLLTPHNMPGEERTGGFDARTRQTVIYYVLLWVGAFAFYKCLFTMTDFKEDALVSFTKSKGGHK